MRSKTEGFDATEPGVRAIALSGAVIVILLIGIILALQAYVDDARQQEIFVKQLQPVSEELKTLRAREDAELTNYSYTDRAKGQVRIPVERAMELLVKEAAGESR
jgi:hypothetical protein